MPLPDVLPPSVIHAALLVPFHAQPLCVEMPIEPPPAVAATLAADGASAYVQLVPPPCFDARKFATVSAFWLCTRTTSAVDVEPSRSLVYVMFGLEKYGMRVQFTP